VLRWRNSCVEAWPGSGRRRLGSAVAAGVSPGRGDGVVAARLCVVPSSTKKNEEKKVKSEAGESRCPRHGAERDFTAAGTYRCHTHCLVSALRLVRLSTCI
jgi:hypothetical protein